MDKPNISYLTEQGLRKLKEELNYLKNIERPTILKQISQAREKSSSEDNPEFNAVLELQEILEMKISRLEKILSEAKIIDKSKLSATGGTHVSIFSKVTMKNLTNNEKLTYTIVPENEVDLKKGKISVNSPIAQGLIGKKTGEKVDIQVPTGKIVFKILKITI